MRVIICCLVLIRLLTVPVSAQNIGVSMARFDDTFLTVLRNGMEAHTAKLKGVKLQMEDGSNDTMRQLDQIQNFIANKATAIIVTASDTDVTPRMTKLASDAKIPLVYLNRQPADLDHLPEGVAFVASNEVDSGTLEMVEVCKLLNGQGNIVVLGGEMTNQAARQRIRDVKDVIGKAPCNGIKIIGEQAANWDRLKANDVVASWLSAGLKFDAVVAGNDEMALGAIQALKNSGIDMKKVVVGGIDATREALTAVKAGDLDVTVFQDAEAQGATAVDTALKLARGEHVEQTVWIPFELVTPENVDRYAGRN